MPPLHAAPTQQSAPRHAAQHWPALVTRTYLHTPSGECSLHCTCRWCCVVLAHPSIHPSKSTDTKRAAQETRRQQPKKKRHTQGTHASISPLDAQMPCFAVLVVEPASPRSIHPKPATNGPPHLISSQDRRNQSPYATHPSIHRTSSLLLCLLPIYHRPPCEPAEETKTPKKN